MKKVFTVSLLFIVLLAMQSFSKEVVADKIVATVEGQPITAYELSNIAGFYHTRNLDALVNKVVDDYVIKYYAKKLGIVVNDEDVNRFVDNLAKRNNMPADTFLQKVKESGIDIDYYKKGIALSLYRRKFAIKMFAPAIRITKADIERYYKLHKDEFKANPVLIMDIISVRSRELAETIYSKLQNGGNFKSLQKQFSIDKGGPKAIPLSAFNKTIQSELSNLKIGDISNIIEANNNFYIVKLLNKKGTQVNADTVSTNIRTILFGKKIESKLSSWLKMVKARTDIEIFK